MDERLPDYSIIIKCALHTQKNTRILHVFRAEQFKNAWRPGTRSMYPAPPIRDRQWWHNHYRLRFDGRWHGQDELKYRFYTKTEISEIVSNLLEG